MPHKSSSCQQISLTIGQNSPHSQIVHLPILWELYTPSTYSSGNTTLPPRLYPRLHPMLVVNAQSVKCSQVSVQACTFHRTICHLWRDNTVWFPKRLVHPLPAAAVSGSSARFLPGAVQSQHHLPPTASESQGLDPVRARHGWCKAATCFRWRRITCDPVNTQPKSSDMPTSQGNPHPRTARRDENSAEGSAFSQSAPIAAPPAHRGTKDVAALALGMCM